MKIYLALFYGIIVEQSGPEYHVWFHVSFQGWDVDTPGNISVGVSLRIAG